MFTTWAKVRNKCKGTSTPIHALMAWSGVIVTLLMFLLYDSNSTNGQNNKNWSFTEDIPLCNWA